MILQKIIRDLMSLLGRKQVTNMSTITNDQELNQAIESGRVKETGECGAFKVFEDSETNETWLCI